MSLLLAPYNNAMRLGQGFNSYTQQICVDDAVLVNPERAENVLSNDGTTMRMLAERVQKASVWRQMKEYVVDGKASDVSTDPVKAKDASATLESTKEEKDKDDEAGGEKEGNDEEGEEEEEKEDEKETREEEVKEDEEDKREKEEHKEEEAKKKPVKSSEKETESSSDPASSDAQKPDGKPDEEKTAEEIEAELKKLEEESEKAKAARKRKLDAEFELKKREIMKVENAPKLVAQTETKWKEINQGRDTAPGGLAMLHEDPKTAAGDKRWTVAQSRGTSQIVAYKAEFIDKLSEISDDMNISAALGIKTDSFALSGRGSFVNTDKFFDSDIRFYLSVKVINSSINFKDALEYNPIASISESDKEHLEVFGDSFISGFLEGGELNAVVMIKVLNDVKKRDIQAEAKVALTTSFKAEAEGNLALAKANIAMNTETTIQVSWCGGASIKPYDEPWTIDSLLAAANRFPYLVSQFPQRTHAILTRYDTLRSFVRLRPRQLSKIGYENAAVYTNTLMDAYLEYKNLYKRVAASMRDVQSGVKRFRQSLEEEAAEAASSSSKTTTPSRALVKLGLKPFPASLAGLELARRTMRNQMSAIVSEVDLITKDPAQATMERDVTFAGPASFASLLPVVEYKVRRLRSKPLSGQKINDEVNVDSAKAAVQTADLTPHLFEQYKTDLKLSQSEEIKIAELERDNVELAETTRLTAPLGALGVGEAFCTLDLDLRDPIIVELSVGLLDDDLCCLSCTYANGLTISLGDAIDDYPLADDSQKPRTAPTGEAVSDDEVLDTHGMAERVKWRKTLDGLGLTGELITSCSIEVDADNNEDTQSVVGVHFVTNRGRSLTVVYKGDKTDLYEKRQFEKPICDGYVSGFWGRQLLPQQQSNEAEFESDGDEVGPPGCITRLGLVWTQAVAKESVFDEDMPIPCLSSSFLSPRSMITPGQGVKSFNRTLPGLPQLLVAPTSLSFNAGSQPALELKATAQTDKLAYHLSGDSQSPLAAAWMVLPELETTHMQCGTLTLKPDESHHQGTARVSFELPFEANAKPPLVVCWLMGFHLGSEKEGSSPLSPPTGESKVSPSSASDSWVDTAASSDEWILRVSSTDATARGFKVTVGDPNTASDANHTLTKFASTTIGWLALDQGGVKKQTSTTAELSTSTEVKAATNSAKGKEDQDASSESNSSKEYLFEDCLFYAGDWEGTLDPKKPDVAVHIDLPAKFKRAPRKHFFGFSELRGKMGRAESLAITSVDSTNTSLDVKVTTSDIRKAGLVWVSAL